MARAPFAVALIATTAAGIVLASPAFAAAEKNLGKVHFSTSCTPAAQKLFDRAMTYQHSFWYRTSKQAFDETLKADPTCAIAYWGIGLSLLNNPFTFPPAKNLPEGLAALEKGKAVGAKSARENDLINALATFYIDHDKLDHRARVVAYFKAMEEVAQRYPTDDEVQIYYALALNVAAAPGDKTYANQLKAAAILENIFKRQPQHPGVAHYLIHTYDYPPIADKGIDAARRYSKIAPAAPHAQHMPSHIFTRVGYWKDSIASNTISARAARENRETVDQLHAMDYLVYAHLQLGQDRKAGEVVAEMNATTDVNTEIFPGLYALAVSPARYTIERGDWKGAAALQVRPTKFAFVDAMTHFARAMGAARSGQPEAAKADIAKLAELRDRLLAEKNAYWAEQVDVQWKVASAWLLHAEGKYDEALAAMKLAADAEDKTEKHPVTPGVPVPARELLGSMLLDRGASREALAAFEATLKKEPNRRGAMIGAAKAAEKSGDKAKARQYYGKLAGLSTGADRERPELAEVRAFVRH